MIWALFKYNISLSLLYWIIGCLAATLPTILFAAYFGTIEFRESVSLAWLGWIISLYCLPLLSSVMAAELFGRERCDQQHSYFATLPITRNRWIAAKVIACGWILVFWIGAHQLCGIALMSYYGSPATWDLANIRWLVYSFCSVDVAIALTAGAIVDQVGSIAAGLLLSWVVVGGIATIMGLLNFSFPAEFATFSCVGLIALVVLFAARGFQIP